MRTCFAPASAMSAASLSDSVADCCGIARLYPSLHTLPGGIVFDMSFPNADTGYAVMLGLVDSGLAKFTRSLA